MDNIIRFTGIKSPRYRAQRVRQDRDQDLFVELLANHPDHIARAQAKREAYIQEKAREAAEEIAMQEERERLLTAMGQIAVFALLAVMLLIAL